MGEEMDYQALAEFRHEIRRFLNFSEQAARMAGIEPQQHQALLAIKGLNAGPNGKLPARTDVTVGVLAERLQIQHHSAVELSNRLQANGLIARSRNGNDRRQVHLRLTPRGEKLLRGLSAMHHRELRTAGPRLIGALTKAIHGRVHGRGTARPQKKSKSGRKQVTQTPARRKSAGNKH